MVLFEDALNIVLSQKIDIRTERVGISESSGRILAEDIFSDMDMPPFDKSAVDGYACLFSDVGIEDVEKQNPASPRQAIPRPETLQVIETIPAGTAPKLTISTGKCSKIMTGAMIPPGADCVVMVEDTEAVAENVIRITRLLHANNICYRGEDIKTGELILPRGLHINPAHIAVLASAGAIQPLVAKSLVVGIISTGDELVEPAEIPGPAQIRNSNAWQLEAQLKSVPVTPLYYGIAADSGPELREIIDKALAGCDVVLLTGGVSMGDFDFVPAIMQEAGVSLFFKSLAIQPGKPTVFGRKDDTFIFGLPGNPVSSFVLFEMMVRPFLLSLMGSISKPVELQLPMGVDYARRKSVRKTMIPVIIRNSEVFPAEYHGSAHIQAYTVANAMMVLEIGTHFVSKGEKVHVRPL